jgi:HTH-type transcriptional regulator / antitoxin HigA
METKITEAVYETALARIEELLPLVTDNSPSSDHKLIELQIMSDIVEKYEDIHYPIGMPLLADVMRLRLEEEEMTQRTFAEKIGVSPSRVSEYLNGKSEPSLKIARSISKLLHIEPAIVLGVE